MRIVFATENAGKLREIKDLMADTDARVFSPGELCISSKAIEYGKTFGENAFIKADWIYNILEREKKLKDTIVMADDSGLLVDFLDGAPGVHSSRFMGHETSYTLKNKALLDALCGVEDEKRTAAFVCHITALTEDGKRFDADGILKGTIAHEIKGEEGFGYDPIFLIPEKGKTVAQLSEREKNMISHRSEAMRKIKTILNNEGYIYIVKQ